MDEYEKVRQIEEAHLAESMERLIMEAYKLLQKGDMEQAESLLQEGRSYMTAANPTADLAVKAC
jgi:hypothetical protein